MPRVRGRELTDVITGMEAGMVELEDGELTGMTEVFRQRLADGETLDDILPEAFAVVREASRRVLGMRHYDVQILGGIILHRGSVAQMNTGEGKTLVATLPAYLNALTGKGVYIATVNDFLALRDANEMGVLYKFLGLSCEALLTMGVERHDDMEKRRICAEVDVVYVTGQNLAFNWLFDQRVLAPENEIYTRPLNYAIIDEADSILIDEAVNPMILGEMERLSQEEMRMISFADMVAGKLTPCPTQMKDGSVILIEDQEKYGGDFACDRVTRSVNMTLAGQKKLVDLLVSSSQLPPNADENALWQHARSWGPLVTRALQARHCYLRDTHYVVVEDEVKIVNESTGRISDKTRWQGGIHQAVEAKEGLPVRGDNVTFAAITYMMFFSMFEKLAGMTGTALPAKYELFVNYRLPVYVVPPHRAIQRTDTEMQVYFDRLSKFQEIGKLVVSSFNRDRPVLIGTESVEESALLHDALKHWYPGIKCQLLNAKPEFVSLEAEIVAQAGLPAAVTISTAMAGRGVDIKLGGDPYGLTKGALQRAFFPWMLENGEEEVAKLPFYRIRIDFTKPNSESLPPAVAGLLFRAVGAIRNQIAKGSLPRHAVDAFIERVMETAQLIFQAADRKVVAGGERLPLNQQLAIFMTDTEVTANGDAVFKDAVNAALAMILYFREYCAMLGQEVRAAGGLMVIGASWMVNERVATQLRGRAGRQGDPGETYIFACPEDLHVPPPVKAYSEAYRMVTGGSAMADAPVITVSMLKAVNCALYPHESFLQTARSQMKRDDQVFQAFRISWYKLRRMFLAGSEQEVTGVLFQYIQGYTEEVMAKYIDPKQPPHAWPLNDLFDAVAGMVSPPADVPLAREYSASNGTIMTEFSPILIRINFLSSAQRLAIARAIAEGSPMPEYEHDYPITLRVKAAMRRHQRSVAHDDQRSSHRHLSGRYRRQAMRLQEHLVGGLMVAYFMHERANIDLGFGSEGNFSRVRRTYLLNLMDSLYVTFLARANDLKSAMVLQTPDQRNAEDGFAGLLRKEFVSLLQIMRRTAIPGIFRIMPDPDRMVTIEPKMLLENEKSGGTERSIDEPTAASPNPE